MSGMLHVFLFFIFALTPPLVIFRGSVSAVWDRPCAVRDVEPKTNCPGILERAVKAGRISESDYREANEKYQECLAAKGDDVEFDTDQSTGLMQEHMNTDDNYDSAKANEDSMACAKGTNLQIRDLYERMVQNPSNADEIELVVGCLKRRKLVPDSFTKQDYLTEMGKPEGSSKLDTSSDAFSQCLANPSK